MTYKTILLAILSMVTVVTTNFAAMATDSPTNYTTATWTNGSNMGSGFTPWQLNYTAPEGTPLSEMFNVDPMNFSPEVSWNITSTTNGTASAIRGFKSLGIGEQIYTKFKIDAVADIAARVGFRLYDGNNLIYFAQYEDENNQWNLNNSTFWSRTNPLAVTEFIWGRSGTNEIDIIFKYNGATIVGVTGANWTNTYPDRIEIFSEYQGIETGGIGVSELTAPAIPEPKTISLLVIVVLASVIGILLRRRDTNQRNPTLGYTKK
jgi:hypothetical protein